MNRSHGYRADGHSIVVLVEVDDYDGAHPIIHWRDDEVCLPVEPGLQCGYMTTAQRDDVLVAMSLCVVRRSDVRG